MKEVTLKVYKFNELSEDTQQKVYQRELKNNYNEDIIQLLNKEMDGVLKDFGEHYGIKIHYEIDENDLDFYFYKFKYLYSNFECGKNVYNFIKEKLEEVSGYNTLYSDNHLTDCLKEYIKHFDEHRTFESLMRSCLTIFFSNWQKSLRYYNSFEHFKKDAISNELYYFENGKLYIE